jgi:hypothetical protein
MHEQQLTPGKARRPRRRKEEWSANLENVKNLLRRLLP